MDLARSPELAALGEEARAVGRSLADRRPIREDGWLMGLDLDAAKELAARGWIGMTWPVEEGSGGRPALERLVSHRVRTYDESRLARRTSSGRELLEAIPAGLAFGGQAANHSFWIFPVVSPAPEEWCRRLLNAGFDAARSSTSTAARDRRSRLIGTRTPRS